MLSDWACTHACTKDLSLSWFDQSETLTEHILGTSTVSGTGEKNKSPCSWVDHNTNWVQVYKCISCNTVWQVLWISVVLCKCQKQTLLT